MSNYIIDGDMEIIGIEGDPDVVMTIIKGSSENIFEELANRTFTKDMEIDFGAATTIPMYLFKSQKSSDLFTVKGDYITRVKSDAFSYADVSMFDFPEDVHFEDGCFAHTPLDSPMNDPMIINIKQTEQDAFESCTGFEKIILASESEGTVATNTFDKCSNLEELVLRGDIRLCYNNIGTLTGLKTVKVVHDTVELSGYPFNWASALTDIYVPWDSSDTQNSGAPWGAPAGTTIHYNTSYEE